jgi:hypothetical protein
VPKPTPADLVQLSESFSQRPVVLYKRRVAGGGGATRKRRIGATRKRPGGGSESERTRKRWFRVGADSEAAGRVGVTRKPGGRVGADSEAASPGPNIRPAAACSIVTACFLRRRLSRTVNWAVAWRHTGRPRSGLRLGRRDYAAAQAFPDRDRVYRPRLLRRCGNSRGPRARPGPGVSAAPAPPADSRP